ncbi:hypothetical protein EVB57_001 [Rhizobium phage RHph_Y1_20]|uniref:Uncharacterized protein n=1 Tax=Rhizobium phage RHph_Y1_20 TaxID=2509571 RepID=A0A7S5QYE4_9CAUD|nr:hypothetical protein EVB57_001 [Rhizobium phage RHph_Y1_20]
MTKAIATTIKAITRSDLHKTEQAIMAALKSIQKRGNTLQNDVHKAACSILEHIELHHDVTIVDKFVGALVNHLPASYRINAMRDWLVAFGPVKFENNKAVYVKDKPCDVAAALKEPFWTFSPEKPYVQVDINKMIDALMKKLDTDAEKTNRDHSAVKAALEQAKIAATAKPVAEIVKPEQVQA